MSRVTTVRNGKLEVVKTSVDTQSYTVEHFLSEKERLEARIERAQADISRLNADITVINADLFKLRG
jgi:hypothetical protein